MFLDLYRNSFKMLKINKHTIIILSATKIQRREIYIHIHAVPDEITRLNIKRLKLGQINYKIFKRCAS